MATLYGTPTSKKSTFGTSLKDLALKGLTYFDKPQQAIQSRLAPALFGTKDYTSGYQKYGLSPKAAKWAGFGTEMLADPLNLIPFGLAFKGIKKGASLLKTAPALSKMDDLSRIGKILAKSDEAAEVAFKAPGKIGRTAQAVTRKLPFVDEAMVSTRKLLQRTPVGTRIAAKVDDVFNRGQKAAGHLMRQFETIAGSASDEVFEEAVLFRQKYITTATPEAVRIASKLDDIFGSIASVAGDVGIKHPKLGSYKELKLLGDDFYDALGIIDPKTYFPHAIDVKKLANYKDEAIEYIYKNNKMNRGSATAFVERALKGESAGEILSKLGTGLPKRAGFLEKARLLDLPSQVLRTDKALVGEYIKGATERIAQASVFGVDNAKFNKLTKALRIADDKADTIISALEREMRIAPRNIQLERQLGNIRRFQGLTKLGTAGISNLSQSINTMTTYGFRNTIWAMMQDVFNRTMSRDFATVTGVLTEAAWRDMVEESMGLGRKLIDNIASPGFAAGEKFNRRVAANAGKMYSLDEFAKALNGSKKAVTNLKKMGVNVDEALRVGKLSGDDIINSARKTVETSQFTVRPADLPPVWSSPYGKVFFQFKSFTYKHGEFIVDEVMKQAFRGNMKPLLRYAIIGNAAGNLTGGLKRAIKGTEQKEDPIDRIVENIGSVGGAGFWLDFLESTRSSYAFTNWLIGPSFGDVRDIATSTSQAFGGDLKPIARKTLKTIPVFGRRIQKGLLPTDAQSRTQTLPSRTIIK